MQKKSKLQKTTAVATGLYERNIHSSVKRVGEDEILTEASILDLNHNMKVEVRVCMTTGEILDARAEILKAPFKICAHTLTNIAKIKGMKIERGINKKLIHALGGANGCTHIYELALEVVRLSFNVILGMKFNWQEWVARSATDEKFMEMAMPYLQNSCYPFKKD